MITRKTLTLPSGATIKVCRLSHYVLRDLEKPAEGDDHAQRAFAERTVVVALTKCTGKLHYPDGRKLQIVDKPFSDTDDTTEITINELDQADCDAILAGILSLNPNQTPEAVTSGVSS